MSNFMKRMEPAAEPRRKIYTNLTREAGNFISLRTRLRLTSK